MPRYKPDERHSLLLPVEFSQQITKRAAVTLALQEFIGRREQRRVSELFGKLEWDPPCDCKAERSREQIRS